MITMTDNAVKKVIAFREQDATLGGKPLRMFVQAGGCSGYEYGFGFDEKKVDDEVVEVSGGLSVVIDPQSATYLKGSVVDYVETVEGEGFAVSNPNVSGGCGCGHSFSV